MKASILTALLLVSASALAAQEGQITMQAPTATTVSTADKSNLTEGGFHYSSINDGSSYGAVGVFHEFTNGFAIGARGYMPLQFGKQAAAYMGQIVSRFIINNDINQMFIDANVTQGYFNDTVGGRAFATIGGEFGYMRKINTEIAVGGGLGVDYCNDRITRDHVDIGNRTLYSKLSVAGAFYF